MSQPVCLRFSNILSKSDPENNSVLIVGQVKHLQQLSYSDVCCKLEPRVSAETFKAGVASLHPSPTDTCSLWLNNATVAALPISCSRHNTPSRAHSLSKLVKSCLSGGEEYVVVVCEKKDVFASSAAIARILPLYNMKTSASSSGRTVMVEFVLVGDGKEEGLTDQDVNCLNVLAQSTRLTAKIVDMPCADLHTDTFLDEIQAVGKDLGIEPLIVQGEDLIKNGFGGIYNVGKAAIHQPALAILSHKPQGAEKNIVWVGKGIVFDTGGLCIKSKVGMCGMKTDCGGAAGILGAFQLAVKMGFQENLFAVFCLAENAVGPLALRPDDIITLYSGKTVEINNTDAEGRLVLGDGVAYANKELKADIVVDMATLTGAQGIATGKYHAGLLTNNEDWETACVAAGRSSGELVFPVPYSPELHFSEFNSSVADMKNSVADRGNAQVSCAGLFIGSHLGFEYPGVWLHIDMASPAHVSDLQLHLVLCGSPHYGHLKEIRKLVGDICGNSVIDFQKGDRATGYGPALLNTLFGKLSSCSLLQSISPNIVLKEKMDTLS